MSGAHTGRSIRSPLHPWAETPRRGVDGSTGCLLRGFARSRIPEELTRIPPTVSFGAPRFAMGSQPSKVPYHSRPTKRYASSTDPVTRTPCVRRPGCALLVAAGEQQQYGLGPSDGGPATSTGHSASLVVRVRRGGTAGTAGRTSPASETPSVGPISCAATLHTHRSVRTGRSHATTQ